jgi:hypothetical protein
MRVFSVSGGWFVHRQSVVAALLVFAWTLLSPFASAAPIRVKYKEGVTHGFLVLSTMEGTAIAYGDSTEIVHGNDVTSHLTYHFKDGSLQQEDLVFSQRGTFKLLSYHRIQKGPSFKNAEELSVDGRTGQVNVKSTDDKGKEKFESERMKLPADLANGMVLFLLKNVPENAKTELSFVVATPKPRIVKLECSPAETDPYLVVTSKREALHFVIKVDIGGVAGVIAPLMGKQPPDNHVWISRGDAPTFVKSVTLSYMGGPMWTTELTSPVWPEKRQQEKKDEGSEQKK